MSFACGLLLLACVPSAGAFDLVDFTIDPAHDGPPHTVFLPDFDNFQMCITGTFDPTKCYKVKIERNGGADCGEANNSGTDSVLPGVPNPQYPGFCDVDDLTATSLRVDISPQAASSFKRGDDWEIEVSELNATCSGMATIKVHPILLTIAGCNDTCLLNGTTLTANPNPTLCDGMTELCAIAGGSGNLQYDWDLDGDGQCDDLTTLAPDNCVDTVLTMTTTVKVCITDLGTNVACTSEATTLVTVAPNNCPPDGNPCTDEVCEPGVGCVSVNDDTNSCSDGVFCNGMETCQAGVCVPGTDPCPPDAFSCTVDSCDEVNDVCLYTPVDGFCDNGLYCDGMEACDPGNGDPVTGCADGPDPCPPPTLCDEDNDVCVDCLTNAECDDGQFCNGMETCVNNVCVPGTAPDCSDAFSCTDHSCDFGANGGAGACVTTPNHGACDDGNDCTDDACDPAAMGADPVTGCTNVNNTDPCSDGDLCTNTDMCVNGMCVGTPLDCTHLSNQCNVGVCDPGTGMCTTMPEPDGTPCDDGQFCTDDDVCTGGVCDGDPLDCSDGFTCTTDTCDEVNNVCVHTPIDSVCNNLAYCDGEETCDPNHPNHDPVTGCVPGTDPCPEDGCGCTTVSCDEMLDACIITPDDGACQNGLFCDGAEVCDALLCCQAGTDPCPADNVDCTQDMCDEAGDACLHVPDDSFCQNGLFCDGMEVCDPVNGCEDGADPCLPPTKCDENTGACVECLSDGQCDDGFFCNGLETCNLGSCVPGTPPCPDDGIACTLNTCDEDTDMCVVTPDHGACDNGAFCDGMEVCDPINGDPMTGCADGPDPCMADAFSCTDDICDEMQDICMSVPNDGHCDDGLFCNGEELCDPGVGAPGTGCTTGADPCPSDGVDCTNDSCDEMADACVYFPNDAKCDDMLFCNGVETCNPIVGCIDGVDPCLPDNVPCTVDVCDEDKNMCKNLPDDAFCQDGIYCNGSEVCDPIQGCLDGPDPCTPDAVPCTDDSCDEQGQTCLSVPNDALCSNGLFCDGEEICDPMLGCIDGTDPCSADAVPCTDDFCDEGTDTCHNDPNDSLCDDSNECTDDLCTVPGGCVNNDNGLCGACCLPNKSCLDGAQEATCIGLGGSFVGTGSACLGDSDGDGTDDHCDNCPGVNDGVFGTLVCGESGVHCATDADCPVGVACEPACADEIPTVSQWGLVVLALCLLITAKLYYGRRPQTA